MTEKTPASQEGRPEDNALLRAQRHRRATQAVANEDPQMPEALAEALRDNFSPQGLTLIAGYLQIATAGDTDEGRQATGEAQWLSQAIVEMIGVETYNSLCEEIAI
jgi:hypothetical protein